MSLIPKRKKTAEEIAQLRDSLGITQEAPAVSEPPAGEGSRDEGISAAVANLAEPLQGSLAPLPVPAPPPKPVKSLKRAERIPNLPLQAPGLPEVARRPETAEVRTVRSLRKTEQGPVILSEQHTPPAHSTLPHNRHSDREIDEIRRQAAISRPTAAPYFLSQKAHRAVVISGHLLALGGWYCLYDELPMAATSACVAAALIISAVILIKKPLSRHHGAFISVNSLFVIVFGALYYFPQLRHGT